MNENFSELESELVILEKSVFRDYQMSSEDPNSETAVNKAKLTGMHIVYPTSKQLQFDIDTPHAHSIFKTMLPLLEKYYGIVSMEDHFSKSGAPKRHITIETARDLTNFERIAIQACFGSDRVREFLGVVQERNQDPHPTLFLEK